MNRLELLKLSDLTETMKRSRSSIYRDIRAGYLPKPIHIGGSARWVRDEVESAIQLQIAARDSLSFAKDAAP